MSASPPPGTCDSAPIALAYARRVPTPKNRTDLRDARFVALVSLLMAAAIWLFPTVALATGFRWPAIGIDIAIGLRALLPLIWDRICGRARVSPTFDFALTLTALPLVLAATHLVYPHGPRPPTNSYRGGLSNAI